MAGVFTGFGVIGIIIAVGWGLGRWQVLGAGARPVLSRLIFYVAQPALLFSLIVKSDPTTLFTEALAVQVISVVAAVALYLAIVLPVWRPSGSEAVIGTMSASYVNIGNLGIPIAVYALGDSTQIAPIMLFQMAVYTPLAMICLDVASGNGGGLLPTLRHVLLNPVLIAGVVALGLLFGQVPVPEVVYEPIHLIAAISVPTMLINFGQSLAARRPFADATSFGRIGVATVIKSFVQPAVAWVVATQLFGMSGKLLMICVVMAGLPTAQNIYNYAVQYDTGKTLARDTAFVTTLLAVPIIALSVALLY